MWKVERAFERVAKQPGIAGIGTALPEKWWPLEELEAAGRLHTAQDRLREMGFEGAHVAEDGEFDRLILTAACEALTDAGVEAGDVDVLIWVSALSSGVVRPSNGSNDGLLGEFRYTGSWLQNELELTSAQVLGVSGQGCAGMFAAVRMAGALMVSDPTVRTVLCAGGDALPRGLGREVLYNVISDAACAVVVSGAAAGDRIFAFHQISNGYYWDTTAKSAEIIAAYFPTSQLLIRELFERAGLSPEDIDLFIPTGINATSWPVLLGLTGIPEDRLYAGSRRFGHTVAADSFLYLDEIRRSGAAERGQKLLLFTYGFGSSWSGMILEH